MREVTLIRISNAPDKQSHSSTDSRKISYTAFETPVEKLGAVETAKFLNVSPEMVFKTIVVTRDKPRKPILAVIPGPNSVDLKLLAASLGEKKVHLPT